MKLWGWWKRLAVDTCRGDEELDGPVHVLGALPHLPTESSEGFACRDLQSSLMLQLDNGADDGPLAAVVLCPRDAAAVLEVTQRLRELREREKTSLPPVADFDSEVCWSSGEG
jgi:hypothetical protein